MIYPEQSIYVYNKEKREELDIIKKKTILKILLITNYKIKIRKIINFKII